MDKDEELTLENLNKEAPTYLGVDSMPRARNVTSIKQNYKELYDWLIGLGFPESHKQSSE